MHTHGAITLLGTLLLVVKTTTEWFLTHVVHEKTTSGLHWSLRQISPVVPHNGNKDNVGNILKPSFYMNIFNRFFSVS